MREFFLALTLFIVTWLTVAVLALVVLRWRLHKANRVSATTKSHAPLVWLWSPARPARLHRRLRSGVDDLHAAVPRPDRATLRRAPSLSVDTLREDLEYEAIELDRHLVIASRHPRSRRRALLDQIELQVTEVEHLSLRLARLGRLPGAPSSGWDADAGPPEALERIARQVDLLDQAQDELLAIERAAGLVDLDALIRESDSDREYEPLTPPPGRLPPR